MVFYRTNWFFNSHHVLQHVRIFFCCCNCISSSQLKSTDLLRYIHPASASMRQILDHPTMSELKTSHH
uniref:Uncharacterized protein n=1 Tax=Panagrolaimus sp. JU765 TaxID=591449 RepID=A0AC34QRV7_9BILA